MRQIKDQLRPKTALTIVALPAVSKSKRAAFTSAGGTVIPSLMMRADFNAMRPAEQSLFVLSGGKLTVVRGLSLPRPILAVGDGNTDLAAKPAVDAFAAYVGYVRRETVVAGADFVIASFAEIAELVLI